MSAELTSQELLSYDPANKEVLDRVAITACEEIPHLVDKAKQAQNRWKKLTLNERINYLLKFYKLLVVEKESVAELITKEEGKPFTEALVSEVFAVLETCKWLKTESTRILSSKKIRLNPIFFTSQKSFNYFEPLGLIAIISPWNYPFSIPASSILLALIAGNAVLLKPSPKTPLVAAKLVDLFKQAGFPEGLITLIQGDKEQAERLILSGVNRVIFTGSVLGGREIMSLAAKKLVPVTLELGGKHPAIVLSDVNPDLASSGLVWSAFTNSGQACASIDRLFLVGNAKETVLPKIIAKTKQLKLGNGLDPNTDVGPLVDEQQLFRIKSLLKDAVDKGARILCGGNSKENDLGGYFFETTILDGLTFEMRIMQEEIFGPILPVVYVETAEKAIEIANSSELGLAASIWTENLELGKKLASEIEAGVIWLNDGLFTHVCPDAPWGGVKNSGFGKAHSEFELLEMCNIKNVSISSQGRRDWYFPYSLSAKQYINAGINLLHKKGLLNKFVALKKILTHKFKN